MGVIQTVRGSAGVVSSGHHLASFEAAATLRAGGNAVDAALVAASVLAVVSPHACSIGGDAFILVFDAESGRSHVANGSGAAPQAATLERCGGSIPKHGPLSMTAPGSVAAWSDVATRFGTVPLGDLLAPAIRFARDGFPVYDYLVQNIKARQDLLERNPAAANLFLPGGAPPEAGQRLRQPALAATLSSIAAGGADAFYRGETAQRIASALQSLGGCMSSEDLAQHETLWQEPVAVSIGDADILTAPPNSWGSALLLMLGEIERSGGGLSEQGALAARMTGEIEAWQAAAAAMAPHIADPRAGEAPARALLAGGGQPGATAGPGAGGMSGSDTTGVAVMDAAGNAVTLLQSVFNPFGAGILAEETGITFNNRLSAFSADPGVANCLAPGKRPAHTLVPTLALKGGAPWLAVCTPGAAGQVCTQAQVLHRVLSGEAIDQAIAAPRWSVNPAGNFLVDSSVEAGTREEIARRFPGLKTAGPEAHTFGSLKVAGRHGEDFIGVAEQRRCASTIAL